MHAWMYPRIIYFLNVHYFGLAIDVGPFDECDILPLLR